MKKIIPIILGLLIVFSTFILAGNCPPSLPKTYYGIVSYDGSPLTGNFEIRAMMGSDTVSINDVINGNYEIDVSPCSGTIGEVVFIVGGVEANEKGSYSGIDDWGKELNLNLTINEMPSSGLCGNGVVDLGEECDGDNLAGRDINDCSEGWIGTISCSATCQIDYSNCAFVGEYCGDDLCNNGETCSSCPQDCGACPSNDNSPSGGGPGGGSPSGDSPSGDSPTITTGETTDTTQTNNKTIDSNSNGNQETDPGITGGVIGFMKSGFGIGLIFILLILIVGIGVILVLKRKSPKNE